jgi:hypothetical protein
LSGLRIVVTGLIAQHRFLGGVAWGVLNWIVGLRDLGHDVYYVEDSGEWPYNLTGGPAQEDWVANDCTPNVEHLATVLARYGMREKWAYRFPITERWYGMGDRAREEVLSSADLLLNVSGTLEEPARYRRIPRLVYIDTDPVFTQIGVLRTDSDGLLRKRVDAHDVHFTFGERVDVLRPVTGHRWRPIHTPIPLGEWRTEEPPRDVYTTVMNWTSYEPLVWEGRTYGQKDAEFVKFLDLPARVAPAELEVALPGLHHRKWLTRDAELEPAIAARVLEHAEAPADLLSSFGWSVVDALAIGSDIDSYRSYIQRSKAEWSVAKSGYVRGAAGWFSNRSAGYLAAGRPVVVQDTGFAPLLPVGEGILTFATLDEAVDCIRRVEADYGRHARAARAIADEYFDAAKVLPRMLDEAFEA